jgi:hypothetical protein
LSGCSGLLGLRVVLFSTVTRTVMESRFFGRLGSLRMTLVLPITLAQGVAQFLQKTGEEFLGGSDEI